MTQVDFILIPKFSMISLYGALETLRVANRFAERKFSWRFVSAEGEPVSASNDMPVSVSGRLADLSRPAMVVVCASYEPEQGATRPVLVGISYGGLIAAEYAARHPGAIAGLVVASAPPPGWVLPARAQRYLMAPRLMAPAFWLGAPRRLYPELRAAFPASRDLLHFVVDHGLRIARAPASSARMVRRLRWLAEARFSTGRPIPVPTLIVTGEAALERVVPPEETLRYLEWLPHARVATMPHTGHSGTVTRAGDFARLVADFIISRSLRADRVS